MPIYVFHLNNFHIIKRSQIFPLIMFLQFSTMMNKKIIWSYCALRQYILIWNRKKKIQNSSHLKILSKIKNTHSCSSVFFPAKFFQASLGRKILLKISFILKSIGSPTTWTIDGHLCMITIHKHLITLCKHPYAALDKLPSCIIPSG